MNKRFSKKITICAVLATISLIAFTIENLLPPLFIPGARLGISNAFILIALLMLGKEYALTVFAVKVIFGSIFSGNVSSILYSLPSGFIALVLQILLLSFCNRFSVVAVSVLGGTVNVALQNLTFCLISGSMEYIIYLPYLALTGAISGVLVGFIVTIIVNKLNKILE